MKVSVLIPCHNAGRWVASALDSILQQAWKDLEIIVVNDRSSDNSAEVLAKYAEKGVRVISKKCGSAAKARNQAYLHSTGQFIKFFDADDLLAPDSIRLQMEHLNGSQTAVASAEWGRFHNDDLTTFKLNPETVWRDMDAREWLVEAWSQARPMMQPGLFLFSRKLVEQAGIWNEDLTLIDDFEFYARLLSHASDVRFARGARLFYRSGISGSLSQSKSRRAAESAFRAIEQGTGYLLQHRQDALARKSCANLFQELAFMFYPKERDLCSLAEERVRALGGSTIRPEGSSAFLAVHNAFGWKTAIRLRGVVAKIKSLRKRSVLVMQL